MYVFKNNIVPLYGIGEHINGTPRVRNRFGDRECSKFFASGADFILRGGGGEEIISSGAELRLKVAKKFCLPPNKII